MKNSRYGRVGRFPTHSGATARRVHSVQTTKESVHGFPLESAQNPPSDERGKTAEVLIVRKSEFQLASEKVWGPSSYDIVRSSGKRQLVRHKKSSVGYGRDNRLTNTHDDVVRRFPSTMRRFIQNTRWMAMHGVCFTRGVPLACSSQHASLPTGMTLHAIGGHC